jgi:cysteinyl-tRNA synthetase
MDDDFGTPAAVAAIFDAVKRANVAIDAGEVAAAAPLVAAVRELSEVLGLEVGAAAEAGDDDAEIDALVAARTAARADRDFAEADRVRDELAARGVTLEDTADGTIWHR